MPSINFNGLATGLDTGAMIDQLVAAEKSRATVYEKRVSELGSQGSILDSLVSRLNTMRDKARAIDSSAELAVAKASVSDELHAKVTVAGATPGSHTLRVGGLARGQTVSSTTFATSAAGAAGTGSVAITTGASTVNVAWTAADSLDTIAQRINDANGGVTAAVMHDGSNYRLVATSRATGVAAASTFVEGGNALGWSQPGAVTVGAADASFTFDGIPMTRSKNLVDDVLPGMTMSLTRTHAIGEADTTIDLTVDRDALRDKVKGLVDSYNSVAGLLDSQLRYDGTAKGRDTLFGDSTLRRLQASMTRLVTDRHGGKTLAEIGGAIDRTGRLTFDATKLEKALIADPKAVEGLFVTGGLATKLSDVVEQHVRSGDGILAAKDKALDAQTKVYKADIARIEDAATRVGDRLREQFNALEKAMSALKSQSSQLTAMFG
jgi:flagellar hook-associated protein 2